MVAAAAALLGVCLLQVQKRALMCVQKLMLPKDKLDFLQQAN
jgi:hypothetical protein